MKDEKGFTMIELMIVISIIAIMSAILVPNITQITQRSKLKTDINGIMTIQSSLDLFLAEVSTSPTSLEGIINDSHILITSGYLSKAPIVQYKGDYKVIKDTTNTYKIALILSDNTKFESDNDKMYKYIKGLGIVDIDNDYKTIKIKN